MQTSLFETDLSEALAGFRLRRIEVFNWGTFHDRIWSIEPRGANALLTGDVGSGKSTLVDAITTLLVPHHRIVFNKAAGAEAKERTLYSYIRGEWKNEKDDVSQTSKPVTLRDQNNYTVLLGQFYNEGYAQSVTLAQVFWLKDQGRNPERFFVVAETLLSIAEHFSGFGREILDLKRALRKTVSVDVMDSFREYGGRFRQLFGIEHEQALELFYQTISLKSVGNLTQFIRVQMLEPGDVEPRIIELRQNFENLSRAHDSVLRAKKQIELLAPVVSEGALHQALLSSNAEIRRGRESLEAFFADLKVELLSVRIAELGLELEKTSQKAEALNIENQHLELQKQDLKENIYRNGGERLETISREILGAGRDRDRAKNRREEYDRLILSLGVRSPRDESGFLQNRQEAEAKLGELELELIKIDAAKIEQAVALQELKKQIDGIDLEINSLKTRRNNLPRQSLEIRGDLCEALDTSEAELPFVGELLQVAEKEAEWEGAIERVLHGFALSLLVPDTLYAKVSHYVDLTHLRGRIVYYRTHRENVAVSNSEASAPKSLFRKLQIKPETPFYDWLERELSTRFQYICCSSVEEFQRQPYAITPKGQIKSGGKRHEKDDRRALSDRANFVLGWSNEAKIRTLTAQRDAFVLQAQVCAEAITKLAKRQELAARNRDGVRDLLKFRGFAEIHWQLFARRIEELELEKRSIEESSDILKTLQTKLQDLESRLDKGRSRHLELRSYHGVLQERLRVSEEQNAESDGIRKAWDSDRKLHDFRKLKLYFDEALPERQLNLQNIDKCQTELRSFLQARIDAEDKRLKGLTEKLIRQMQNYKTEYPAETKDVDVSVGALSEYESMLAKLEGEDLPRHELRFKQLLNEGTINSVALLQNHLERSREAIEDKIESINRSLREIEYNAGTYIALVHDRSQDREVRDFQQDLKQCLSHTLEEGAIYNERRFLQVREILERLNGREGLSELDHKWTTKVTDVRNWYEFSASERWREDETEREFYSDSSGKSGGQKEKLAYTVLASALAYQFGLEWNVVRSRSFRFVVIDEAFGRGSDESARYGLELFKKLNLQLLIVTPLQKIHVIENYVRSVNFVHNEENKNSVIVNLTLEQYREQRALHHAALQTVTVSEDADA